MSDDESIKPLSAVLMLAGIGGEVLRRETVDLKKKLVLRDARAEHNLDRLDRMTLALYNLAMDLAERGGKVSASKLATKILAIRDGEAGAQFRPRGGNNREARKAGKK